MGRTNSRSTLACCCFDFEHKLTHLKSTIQTVARAEEDDCNLNALKRPNCYSKLSTFTCKEAQCGNFLLKIFRENKLQKQTYATI